MYKKIITACLAVAALAAFALPASASATSPALTDSTGALVPAGTAVKGTNLGNTTFAGSNGVNIVCSKAVLTGSITKNNGNGEAIEGTISEASFTGTSGGGTDCTSSLGSVTVTTAVTNGTPWCVRATPGTGMVLDVSGGACGSKARAITFVLDVHTFFGTIECKYERTAGEGPVTGTYNTAPEDAKGQITAAGSAFRGESTNSGTCPETGTLAMEFTLEKSAGGELFIS